MAANDKYTLRCTTCHMSLSTSPFCGRTSTCRQRTFNEHIYYNCSILKSR